MAFLPPVMTTSAMTHNSAQLLEEHDSEVGDSRGRSWRLGQPAQGAASRRGAGGAGKALFKRKQLELRQPRKGSPFSRKTHFPTVKQIIFPSDPNASQ